MDVQDHKANMRSTENEIKFYVDSLIVEAIVSDIVLSKNAQGSIVHEMIQKVKEYFTAHIDPKDKVGSFLELIAPGAIGAIWATFRALNLGWLGALFGLAIDVFHIDVGKIFSSIYNSIKGLISENKQTTSEQVEAAVQQAVIGGMGTITEADAAEAQEALNGIKTKSVNMQLRDAKLTKLAMINFRTQKYGLTKNAGLLDAFSTKRTGFANILTRVLSWFFKIALASFGFMVAGDMINHFLDRPNALDGTMKDGKPLMEAKVETPKVSLPVAVQTKFPLNPTYNAVVKNVGTSIWQENILADKSSIENMLLQFAKDVYQGLDGQESNIRTTAGFQAIVDNIVFANRNHLGSNLVVIPAMFQTKKQIVDQFIDDVAKQAGS